MPVQIVELPASSGDNPFDQFDAATPPAAASTTVQSAGSSNPFDQFDAPQATPTPTTTYSLGKSVTGGHGDETEDHYTNQGFSSKGPNLTPGVVAVNTSVYPLGTIFKDPATGNAYIASDTHGNKDPNVVDIYTPPEQYKGESGSRNFQVVGKVDHIPTTPMGIQTLLSQYGKVPEGPSAQQTLSGNAPNPFDQFDNNGNIKSTPASATPSQSPQTQTGAKTPDEEASQAKEESNPFTDFLKRIPASMAETGYNALAGLARTAGELDNPMSKSILTPDAGSIANTADALQNLSDISKQSYGVDPNRDNTVPSKIAQGIGGLVDVAPAVLSGGVGFAPLVAQTFGGIKEADYQQNLSKGMTPEDANSESSKNALIQTGVSVPLYMATGHLAGTLSDLLPNATPQIAKSAAQLIANFGANTVGSAAMRGIEAGLNGQPVMDAVKNWDIPSGLQDMAFAGHATASKFIEDSQNASTAKQAIEKASTPVLVAAASDPKFRQTAPYNPNLIDQEIARRNGAQQKLAPSLNPQANSIQSEVQNRADDIHPEPAPVAAQSASVPVVNGDHQDTTSIPNTGPGAANASELSKAIHVYSTDVYNEIAKFAGGENRPLWEQAIMRHSPEVADYPGAMDKLWNDTQESARLYNEQGGAKPVPEVVRQMQTGERLNPGDAAATKNATVDQLRRDMNLPPAMEVAKRDFGTVWDQAMRDIDANGQAQSKLIDELSEKPRAVIDVENAMLLQNQIETQTNYEAAVRDVNAAYDSGDQGKIAESRLKAALLADQLQKIYDINKSVGTETARGLNARKMMVNEDYSLARMLSETRAAQGGKPLTDKQVKDVTTKADKIKNTQEAMDAHSGDIAGKLRTEVEDAAIKKITKASKGKTAPDPAKIQASLKDKVSKNSPLSDMTSDIQKLAEHFVRQGITDRDKLTDAVHNVIKDIIPDITPRDTRDAISGYGKFTPLSKDAVKVKLRDLKGQMQQVSKLEDMQEKGQLPLKTGMERRVPSDEERRLQQEVNRIKKELNLESVDPENQLKSWKDGVKTRLTNQIADLEHQLASGERPAARTQRQWDNDMQALRTRRDALKDEIQKIDGKPEMSMQQRIKLVTNALNKSIAEYQRRIAENDLSPKRTGAPKISTPEIEALRTEQESLKAQAEEMKAAQKPKLSPEEKAQQSLKARLRSSLTQLAARFERGGPKEKGPETVPNEENQKLIDLKERIKAQLSEIETKPGETAEAKIERAMKTVQDGIDEYTRRLKEGDFSSMNKGSETPDTTELKALRDTRDALRQTYKEAKENLWPKKTEDEIALQAYKTRLENSTKQYQEKLAKGNFSTPVKRQLKLDPDAMRLKAENERAKLDYQRAVTNLRMQNRTPGEKILDAMAKWQRFAILSYPSTIVKLFGAAALRYGITPVEEVAGSVIGKVFPGIASRAPREGGLNVKAEAKAVSQGLTQGIKDAYDYARTGHSDLSATFGKKMSHEDMNIAGRFHGAIKAPVARAEFTRSVEKRMTNLARQGVDITDPMVQGGIMTAAYKDAQRAIFQQDNRASSMIRAGIATLERPDASGHVPLHAKVGATAAKALFPITRVPLNVLSESFQYLLGAPVGSLQAINALRKGVAGLKPDEADLIMRNLKKGSLGTAALLLGFFAPAIAGGFYQPGKKRDPNTLEPGAVRIDGFTAPPVALHAPLIQALQFGANVRHLADSKLRQRDAETRGVSDATLASLMGLVQDAPLVQQGISMSQLVNDNERPKFLGNLARSYVPGFVQQTAKALDTDSHGNPIQRAPETILQNVATGIPGLRENVPEKSQPTQSRQQRTNPYAITL